MRNLLAYLPATASAKFGISPKLLLLACALLACLTAQAQNKKMIDSLMNVYATAKPDTAKLLVLKDIAYEYRNIKPDTCASLATQILEKSEKIGFERGKAWAWNTLGLMCYMKSKHIEALNYYEKALPVFEKSQEKKGIGSVLNNIGNVYQIQSKYTLALEYFRKSLQIAIELNNKRGIASISNNLGNVYQSQGNNLSALESYQKSLQTLESMGDKQSCAFILNNIGLVYQYQADYPLALDYYHKSLRILEDLGAKQGISRGLNTIGIIYKNQGNYPLALEYHQKSLQIRKEIEDKQGIAVSLNNMGMVYTLQGNYPLALEVLQQSIQIKESLGDKQGVAISLENIGDVYNEQNNIPLALENYQKSLQIAEALGDKQVITYSLIGLGQIYQKQKNYDKSIEYTQKSLQIAQEIKAMNEIKEASNTLFETYKLKGDYVKALKYHEMFKQTNDSIFNVDKAKKIANLEARADIERKQKEIEILNKNKELDQKAKEALEKDLKLQSIEAERQKNAKLVLEKQGEADRLLNLALHEKDKNKQDSLQNLAQKTQLEADNLKIKQAQLNAEKKARELEVLKQREAKEFQQYINYLVLAGLLSVLVFAFFIFRSRQKEKKAKEAISEQKEEILQMNEELNTTLTIVESERAKSDKLLLNILPTEVAHELKETGKTDVRYFESVTVLFADVKGFSALATKISPQALIAELDATFSKMDEISIRFGLERIKTIGDCYMACGGLPHANKTHAFDVVLTALNIQHWMNEERKKNPDFWQVRLGAHTGDAVAGVIGKTKFAYDIWGNTVNLASRMESGGEVGKVNVTQQTFEAVSAYFEGDYREEIEAKNIGKVRAYFVSRLKPEFSADTLGFEPNERFWEVYKKL